MNPNTTLLPEEGTIAAQSLPDHPLFNGLSEAHRRILADCSSRATFRTAETLIETGEPTKFFYLVIRGSICLVTPSGHNPVRLQTVGPGGILGWSWLFPPACWHFDAIAEEPTEVIVFDASRLCQECDRDRALGYELFKRMAQRHGVGKSATGETDSTGLSFSGTSDGGETNLPGSTRGNLDAYSLDRVEQLLNSTPGPLVAAWPRVLLDNAKIVFKSVSGAGRSLFSSEPYPVLSSANRSSASVVEHEGK